MPGWREFLENHTPQLLCTDLCLVVEYLLQRIRIVKRIFRLLQNPRFDLALFPGEPADSPFQFVDRLFRRFKVP